MLQRVDRARWIVALRAHKQDISPSTAGEFSCSTDWGSLLCNKHEVQTCDCCVSGQPQYEATKAYMPKEPDELGLKQAELIIVFQKEEGKEAS